MRRTLLLILVCLVLLYGLASLGLYAAMRQQPDKFGAIMSRMPTIAMIVLPFKPLWMSARAGKLNVGDVAPDFALPTVDNTRTVKLSEEYRAKPVVLVFGSYT